MLYSNKKYLYSLELFLINEQLEVSYDQTSYMYEKREIMTTYVIFFCFMRLPCSLPAFLLSTFSICYQLAET